MLVRGLRGRGNFLYFSGHAEDEPHPVGRAWRRASR